MKIAVIGANGRSGRIFVEHALARGHQVTAGTHGPCIFAPHKNLRIVTCDATNPDDVQRFVRAQDAVASFIGHVPGSDPSVQAEAMKCLVGAMQANGPKRLVSLTGTGVRLADDIITPTDRVLNLAISTIDPARIADGIAHADILKNSSLDWTILRVLKLTNQPSGKFILREHGPTKPFTSRAEVADAAIKVLEDDSFIRKMPIIASR